MNEMDLRKKLGEKKYAEVVAHAQQLKAKGMKPDDIAKELTRKFAVLPEGTSHVPLPPVP